MKSKETDNRSKAAVTAMILSTAILAGGCGEDAQAASDIAPTEPTSQTTQETTEAEANVSKAEAETESIIEDTTIDEAEAKKMLKEYSDQIAEADIEDYNEDLVYVFMTNYNEGKSTDESFTLALQHVKDLKAFDEETKAQQQAQYDAEAREAEANKQAEAQTQQPSETTQQEPVSVPIPKQEEQLIQQTEQAQQPQPTPEQNSDTIPAGQGLQPDGSVICSDGSVMKPGDVHVDPSGQKTIYGGVLW